VQGDTQHVVDLEINDTSRIHFDGGSIIRTSRTNPSKSAEAIRQVGEALQRLGVNHLITIGGDDNRVFGLAAGQDRARADGGARCRRRSTTTCPCRATSSPSASPPRATSARSSCATSCRTRRPPSAGSSSTVMGRHAGHLALGIGGSAAATLTVIAEEFPEPHISLERVADTLEGAIIKRRVQGREHGVAILSEGLGEKLDLATLGRRSSATALRQRAADRAGHRPRAEGPRDPRASKTVASTWTITAKTSATSCAARRRARTTSRTAAASATGRALPARGRQQRDGDDPGPAASCPSHAGSWSIPRRARSASATSTSNPRCTRRCLPYMIRLKPEDLANPDSLAALAKAGQSLRDGADRALRPARRARLSARRAAA